MAFLTYADKRVIADCIRQAESHTHGKIVVLVTRESDDYVLIPLIVSLVVALFLPLPLLYFIEESAWVYTLQLLSCVVMFGFLQLSKVKLSLVPKRVKNRRANRFARDQFHRLGLATLDEPVMMVFVSQSERYVEIIADETMSSRVAEKIWQSILRGMTQDLKKKRNVQGFISAVNALGKLLALHFPATGKNPNDMPNHFIEM